MVERRRWRGRIGKRTIAVVAVVAVALLIIVAAWTLVGKEADGRILKVRPNEVIVTQEDLAEWTQNGSVYLATAPSFYNVTFFISEVSFDNYSGLGSATVLTVTIDQFTDPANATEWYEHSLSRLLFSTNETTSTNMTVSIGDRSFAVYEPFSKFGFETRSLIFQQRNVVVTIFITSPLGMGVLDDQIKAAAEAQNSKIVEHLE